MPVAAGATLEGALFDGEDYELLVAGSARLRRPALAIGRVTRRRGIRLNGRRLTDRGYDHLAER